MSLFTKYVVKKEKIGGDWYWCIYYRFFGLDLFLERWNTEESCFDRLDEITNPQSFVVKVV